ACLELLINLGINKNNIIVTDSKGVLYKGRPEKMDVSKQVYAIETDLRTLDDALEGADIFLGVSVAGLLKPEMVAKMVEDPLILALANPVPEIMPEEAKKVGVRIIGTGRSDLPNQINNVLGFPGIFRGALDIKAREINESMKMAASYAIASLVPENKLHEDYFIPTPFDRRIVPVVASEVARVAIETKVARDVNREL
ncbi:MAG TPA: NAD-dependent malic enzyme, partial [Candidatus Omnitrophica bacterium]|nr:NAD-dependent malic enzyme [Candidatus Omnitrophota bacterium]